MRLARLAALLAITLALLLPVPSRAGDPPAGQKHFLWKVTSAGGVAYLLGTLHVGAADFYPLAPVIENSFKEASTLVEEIEAPNSQDQARMRQYIAQNGTYQPGDTIADHLSETTRDWLAAYAQATRQLAPNYTNLKPWLLSLVIDRIEAQRLGLDKEQGIDKHFTEEAAKMHKPIAAFETVDFQIRLFTSFPDGLQDKLLFSTLEDAKRGEEGLKQILAAWKSGDGSAIDAVITQKVRRYPFLQPVLEKLLYERNDAMTRKLEDFLRNRTTYFVAVGAAHLVGERGIVNQLRGKKYTVEHL